MRRAIRSRRRGHRHRAIAASLAAMAITAATIPAVSWGHAVVFPKASTPGAYEKYVLRVPNEKAVATTRVELRFPAGVRVTSFADVPGWQLEIVTDSVNAIRAAIWGSSRPTCSARSPSRTPLIVTANGSLPTLDFRRNLRIFPMI